jgi:hypothetical protein
VKNSRPDLYEDKPDGRRKGDAWCDPAQRREDQSERPKHLKHTDGSNETIGMMSTHSIIGRS